MKTAILLGSSRSEGNTQKLAKLFIEHRPADLFNLNDYSISVFDYQHKNKDDDFLGLAKKLQNYEHLIFATPVYWYCMSAQMKIFFDRLSDLLIIDKDLGRAFKGKSCSVLSTGVDKESPECFVEPFKLTASLCGLPLVNNKKRYSKKLMRAYVRALFEKLSLALGYLREPVVKSIERAQRLSASY